MELEGVVTMARCAIVVLLLGILLLPASGDVRVWGTVYAWHPEILPPERPWFDQRPEFEFPGQGTYLPVPNLLVQVEFGAITPDPTGYTSPQGQYLAKYRNPFDGHFDVDLEIRTELFLGQYDIAAAAAMPMSTASQAQLDGLTTVTCRPEKNSVWPYNGQTGNLRMGPNSEVKIDAWIGGPKDNLTFYAYGDQGGRKTLGALHLCLAVREAYNWLTGRAVASAHIWRDTNIAYPQSDNSHYQPMALPPGIGNIYIDTYRLHADDWGPTETNAALFAWLNWQRLACTAMHEYGHKTMHDVYWALPQSFKIWQGSDHTTTTCKNAELAWKEGWAEFLAAAIRGRPVVNGRPVKDGQTNETHLEQAWVPPTGPWTEETLPGELVWRSEIPDDKRAINEVENAAVLWDIYDPTGPEYFPQSEQEKAQAAGWPAPVQWFDRLEDPQATRIWSILVKHNPDCLIDEGDLFEDSFWYYWLHREYGTHDFLIHGLKAAMYNRGIHSSDRPQHAPQVQMTLNADKTLATLTVTEPDAEDRGFLSYNIACGGAAEVSQSVVYDRDKPLVCTAWTGNEATTSITLPAPGSYTNLTVLVHDDMNCVFASIGEGGYQGRRVDWSGFIQVEKGGRETQWHVVEPGMKDSKADFQFDNKREVINDWFAGGGIFLIPSRNVEFNDTVYKCRRWSVKPLFGTALTQHPDFYTAPLILKAVPADMMHLILGFVSQATPNPYPNGEVFDRRATIRLLDKNRTVLSEVVDAWQDRGGPHTAVIYFPIGEAKLGDPSTTP